MHPVCWGWQQLLGYSIHLCLFQRHDLCPWEEERFYIVPTASAGLGYPLLMPGFEFSLGKKVKLHLFFKLAAGVQGGGN